MSLMPGTKDDGSGLLLSGARLVLPDRVAGGLALLVGGGRVRAIVGEGGPPRGPVRTLDLGGLTLYPGFVDVHIHGALGVDTLEAEADDLRRVARFLAGRGVTAWLPTLVPGPEDEYRRAADSIARLMRDEDAREPAARAVGIHYEGPFVNREQCGALRPAHFRAYREPSDLDALAVPESGARMMTLAPEVEGGVELVRELVRRGWVVSVGHTRAATETLERAREAGARHVTHFPNAMPPLHHRAPGPVAWGLLGDGVSVDVIADGVHCDPQMLRLVLRCKGAERVSLISDAVAPAGLGDGEFRLWGETIRVEGGRTRNERGSIAGSVITMLDAVRLMLRLGVTEPEAARMASLNPARLLGLGSECGSIEEGKRADLVALDSEGRVRLTLVGGRVAFDGLDAARS